jgi:hypothetical protein
MGVLDKLENRVCGAGQLAFPNLREGPLCTTCSQTIIVLLTILYGFEVADIRDGWV